MEGRPASKEETNKIIKHYNDNDDDNDNDEMMMIPGNGR